MVILKIWNERGKIFQCICVRSQTFSLLSRLSLQTVCFLSERTQCFSREHKTCVPSKASKHQRHLAYIKFSSYLIFSPSPFPFRGSVCYSSYLGYWSKCNRRKWLQGVWLWFNSYSLCKKKPATNDNLLLASILQHSLQMIKCMNLPQLVFG